MSTKFSSAASTKDKSAFLGFQRPTQSCTELLKGWLPSQFWLGFSLPPAYCHLSSACPASHRFWFEPPLLTIITGNWKRACAMHLGWLAGHLKVRLIAAHTVPLFCCGVPFAAWLGATGSWEEIENTARF